MDIDTKYNLITRDLQEVVGSEVEIKNILSQRSLKIYWGTAPTSQPHIGYIVPMLKIIDFLKADCEVCILIADLHATLDSLKSTHEQVESRSKYYELIIKELLQSLNVNSDKLIFVKGSEYQLSRAYTMDMYRAHTLITTQEAKKAGSEAVKQSDNPLMSSMMYPTLQALDEQYLGADAQFGGVDQRKIFMHAHKVLPLLGYKKRIHFMNPLIPGIRFEKSEVVPEIKPEDSATNDAKEKEDSENIEQKMSSTDENTKIDLLDTKNMLKRKINKAFCLPGDLKDNSLLILVEKIIFPVLQIKNISFIINRKVSFGGPICYSIFNDLKNDFESQVLHPGDLKLGIIDTLDIILAPIRKVFDKPEYKLIRQQAYPQKN